MATEKEIRDYCLRRPLFRPKVNYFLALSLFLFCEAGAEWLSYRLCNRLCIGFSTAYCCVQLLLLLLLGRWAVIFFVKLYQRHAPEHIRRRCHCRPSCSEYALVVLRRRGLLIGGYQALKRIFFTCGAIYKEDMP